MKLRNFKKVKRIYSIYPLCDECKIKRFVRLHDAEQFLFNNVANYEPEIVVFKKGFNWFLSDNEHFRYSLLKQNKMWFIKRSHNNNFKKSKISKDELNYHRVSDRIQTLSVAIGESIDTHNTKLLLKQLNNLMKLFKIRNFDFINPDEYAIEYAKNSMKTGITSSDFFYWSDRFGYERAYTAFVYYEHLKNKNI